MRRVAPLLLFALLSKADEPLSFQLVPRATLEEWIARAPMANADRLQSVRQLFEAAGCGPELTEQRVKGSKLPNLICRLPGEPGAATIVIGAHFDKVKPGQGVIDNWTGSVLLPALYKTLAPAKRRHTFLFVSFTDEEVGLVGSRFFAKQIPKADLANYRFMVNLDSLGAGETNVWASHAHPRLLQVAHGIAQSKSLPLTGINLGQVGRGDSDSFTGRKIPAIDFHSLTQENYQLLHSERDAPEAFRPDAYWSSYRFLTGFIGYLDRYVDGPLP